MSYIPPFELIAKALTYYSDNNLLPENTRSRCMELAESYREMNDEFTNRDVENIFNQAFGK